MERAEVEVEGRADDVARRAASSLRTRPAMPEEARAHIELAEVDTGAASVAAGAGDFGIAYELLLDAMREREAATTILTDALTRAETRAAALAAQIAADDAAQQAVTEREAALQAAAERAEAEKAAAAQAAIERATADRLAARAAAERAAAERAEKEAAARAEPMPTRVVSLRGPGPEPEPAGDEVPSEPEEEAGRSRGRFGRRRKVASATAEQAADEEVIALDDMLADYVIDLTETETEVYDEWVARLADKRSELQQAALDTDGGRLSRGAGPERPRPTLLQKPR